MALPFPEICKLNALSDMRKLFFIIILAIGTVTCACNGTQGDGPEVPAQPQISLSVSQLIFDHLQGSQTMTVTSDAEWGVSSSETWCNVSPTGGLKGSSTVTVSATANNTAKDRNALITFRSGSYKKELQLMQHLNPEDTATVNDPSVNTPQGYKLVWRDEFDRLNTSEWWFETGGGGWGNNEIQRYIPAVEGKDTCAQVSGGTLKIIARQSGTEVLSVRMNTARSWTYGYFEARLKLPVGKGTWPAFWMMPKNFTAWPDDGEIDIMEEVGYRPNYVSSSIHCKAYNHSIGTQKTAEKYIATAQSEFHVYAVEWTQDYIFGYIDGVRYFTFTNDKKDIYDSWPFYKPFYLKLNLAWGGNWGGAQGVDPTFLPATYEIDYVRVFQKK